MLTLFLKRSCTGLLSNKITWVDIIIQERIPYQAAHISVQKGHIICQGKHITLRENRKVDLGKQLVELFPLDFPFMRGAYLLLLCGIVSQRPDILARSE